MSTLVKHINSAKNMFQHGMKTYMSVRWEMYGEDSRDEGKCTEVLSYLNSAWIWIRRKRRDVGVWRLGRQPLCEGQSAKEVRSMLQSPRTMQRGHPWMDSSFDACSLVMPADQTLNFGQTIDILEAADRGLIWFIWSSTGTIYHCQDDGSKLGALGNPSIEPGVQLDNWMLYRSCWCLFSRKLAMYF